MQQKDERTPGSLSQSRRAEMQLRSHVGTEKVGAEPDVSRGLQLVTGQNPKLNA